MHASIHKILNSARSRNRAPLGLLVAQRRLELWAERATTGWQGAFFARSIVRNLEEAEIELWEPGLPKEAARFFDDLDQARQRLSRVSYVLLCGPAGPSV